MMLVTTRDLEDSVLPSYDGAKTTLNVALAWIAVLAAPRKS